MKNLTTVVLTLNEENYIRDCLESLRWCENVIVLDSFSTDRIIEIAEDTGANIITRFFENFSDQHNTALDMVNTDLVLSVDADERVSPELAVEILSTIHDPKFNGYWIPRKNYQLGRLILNAGLYPDYQLRLIRKGKGRYDPNQKVHERVILDGEAGYLKNPLIHISCETWQDFIDHQATYARMKAEVHFERGVKPTYHFIVGPALEFVRRYLVLRGYKDGMHGLKLSTIFAYYYFRMYVELHRLWRAQKETATA